MRCNFNCIKFIGWCLLFLILGSGCEEHVPERGSLLLKFIPNGTFAVLHTDDPSGNRVDGLLPYTSTLWNGVDNFERAVGKNDLFLETYTASDACLVAYGKEGRDRTIVSLLGLAHDLGTSSAGITDKSDYNGQPLETRTYEGTVFYTAQRGGVAIASSSRLVVEGFLRLEIADYVFDKEFENVFERTATSVPSLYLNAAHDRMVQNLVLIGAIIQNANYRYGSWVQLEAYSDEVLGLEGVITYTGKDQLQVLENLGATKHKLIHKAPTGVDLFRSIGYTDADLLIRRIAQAAKKERLSPLVQQLLSTSEELAFMTIDGAQLLAFLQAEDSGASPFDPEEWGILHSSYRDVGIYKFREALKINILPLSSNMEWMPYYIVLDDAIVSGSTFKALEQVIAHTQSGTTIGAKSWWADTQAYLATRSSLLELQHIDAIGRAAGSSLNKKQDQVLKEYAGTHSYTLQQLVLEEGYGYYRHLLPSTVDRTGERRLDPLGSYRSEHGISRGPYLFPNHITKGQDVLFQDNTHLLWMLSKKGVPQWSKQLDGPILGGIHAIDAFKNGRKQLVFHTAKTMYNLDRSGKKVNAYPIKTKNEATQPLSVFDYDSNHNYRLLTTQGNALVMYDHKGSIVTGFKYQPTSAVSGQPIHHRHNGLDYIIVPLRNDRIAILDRRGNIRTMIKGDYSIQQPFGFMEGKVTGRSINGGTTSIDLKTGLVQSLAVKHPSDLMYYKDGTTEVNLTHKGLRINGKMQINDISREDFISILPLEKPGAQVLYINEAARQVYLMDKTGGVVDGFPVYGQQRAAIGGAKTRYLTTIDGNDILIYSWQEETTPSQN